MVTEIHRLEIETILVTIDKIITKYTPLPEGLVFIKGKRNPITDKHLIKNYIKKGLTSNIPYHPYLGAYLVKDIIELILLDTVDHRVLELFFKNTFKNNIDTTCHIMDPIYSINKNLSITDLILKATNELCTPEDIITIEQYIEPIELKLRKIINKDINYVYEIDIENNYFNIKKLINICEYRYHEVLKDDDYE